jgi:DNA-binding transcriptional LysR family regulator
MALFAFWGESMDVQGLRVFLTVAKERSFSRAATVLCRTQPAISQAVRRLEEELGQCLIDRRSKNGLLTSAGEMLVGYSERVLHLVDEAESAMQKFSDRSDLQVIVGATEATVSTLVPAITRVRTMRPDLEITVRHVPEARALADLQNGSIHFSLCTLTPVPPMVAIPFGTVELVVLMHPSHALAGETHVAPEQLGGETIVVLGDRPAWACRVATVSLPSVDAVKRAALMKAGVAVLPRRCAVPELESGTLVAASLALTSTTQALYLVHGELKRLTPAADVFRRLVLTVDSASPALASTVGRLSRRSPKAPAERATKPPRAPSPADGGARR